MQVVKHSAPEAPYSGSYIYFFGILHPARFSMLLEYMAIYGIA
jgi:hypothetical protein